MIAWLRTRHEVAPLATALGLYLVLAVVRVSGAYQVPFMVLSLLLTPCVLLAVPRDSWPEIGLRPVSGWRLVAGVALVVAVYADVVACNVAAFGSSAGNWTTGIQSLFRDFGPLVMIVAMGLVIPALEEVCYRGVLFGAAERTTGVAGAVVLTSAGWALVHLGNYGLVPFNPDVICGVLPSVFCMGLALGICRVITGSCVGSIVAQGVANLLLVAWVMSAA
jgi:membrane protease YdiL (CAAX protease family)